jgi:hypothetical protein
MASKNVSSKWVSGNLVFYDASGDAIFTIDGANRRLSLPSGAGLTGAPVRKSARSVWFNIDNGSGTTIDDVLLKPTSAITITAARILYVDATTGTVAAGNAKIGTTLGGAEIVAATAYEDAKAVGVSTAMTIVDGAVAAGGSVFVRHTGIAATAAGQAVVEIEYTVDA